MLETLIASVPLRYLQLHGKESVERVTAIRQQTKLPLIKAMGISSADDLQQIEAYKPHVDWFLFDAKPPKGANRPGGNAVSFDWSILSHMDLSTPWMLAGGLTADNVRQAISVACPTAVDASSSLESSAGVKDVAKIRDFCHSVNHSGKPSL